MLARPYPANYLLYHAFPVNYLLLSMPGQFHQMEHRNQGDRKCCVPVPLALVVKAGWLC